MPRMLMPRIFLLLLEMSEDPLCLRAKSSSMRSPFIFFHSYTTNLALREESTDLFLKWQFACNAINRLEF